MKSAISPVQESIRLQVRYAVRDAGHTQVWVARSLGITERQLGEMLTGKALMPLLWAERIADLCGLEIVVSLRCRTKQKET